MWLLILVLVFGVVLRWGMNKSQRVRNSNRWALEMEIEQQERRLAELRSLRTQPEYSNGGGER